ncbi:MAG: hypothetical protein NVS9B15_18310 [Acidobacteriaceae bacterium]
MRLLANFCLLALIAHAQDTCLPFDRAKELSGTEGCIVGRVVKIGESRAGNMFLNFCKDYRNCAFQAVVLQEKSEELGDIRDLEGKVVEIRGAVKNYEGRPEIQLTSRAQLTLAKDEAVKQLMRPEPADMAHHMHEFGNRPHVPRFSHPKQARGSVQ